MDTVIVGYTALVLVLGGYTVWALKARRKWPIVATLPVMYAIGFLIMGQALGQPKPAWFTHIVRGEAEVLGVGYDEGKWVYLLLLWQGETEPRYYRMPWVDGKRESQLADDMAAVKREGKGRRVKIKFDKDGGWAVGQEKDDQLHPAPPQPQKSGG